MNADGSAHVDLRRVKSATEVIGDALRCYGRYPALFAALTLAVVVPYGVIVLLIDRAGLLGVSRHGATAAIIVVLFNLLLVGPLISALHVHAVAEIGEGREPNLRQVFARGVRVLPVVAAAEIVAGIATGIGFLALIVPGLILLARWAVVAQAAAIERVDWSSARRRSAELTRGSYLHVLGGTDQRRSDRLRDRERGHRCGRVGGKPAAGGGRHRGRDGHPVVCGADGRDALLRPAGPEILSRPLRGLSLTVRPRRGPSTDRRRSSHSPS